MRAGAAIGALAAAVSALAIGGATAHAAFSIDEPFDEIDPCEGLISCGQPFDKGKLPGSPQSPSPGVPPMTIVAFASGWDLSLSDPRGGIWLSSRSGTMQRKLVTFTHSNRDFEEHGLNLPDDHPGTGVRRLTSFPGLDTEPTFSPDGTRIAWATELFGKLDIVTAPIPSSGLIQQSQLTRVTSTATIEDIEPAWNPNGTEIAFTRLVASGRKDIFIAKADGSARGG